MIQAFFSDRADPAFTEGISPGSPVRSVNDMKSFRQENRVKHGGELLVIVEDQKAEGWVIAIDFPEQVSGLLRSPKLVWIGGDT